VNYGYMGGNGDWLAYGRNGDGLGWGVPNGDVIAERGQSIDPLGAASLETWSDTTFAQGFFLALGGPTGSYAVGGTTSNSNSLADAVVVLNGTTVIARENDPVDLNNDGIFNDAVYIRTFNDDYA